ncbi:MAG: hypothetical protein JSV04_05915, partial [Candidatus Heimdallarchaeota archaeon]
IGFSLPTTGASILSSLFTGNYVIIIIDLIAVIFVGNIILLKRNRNDSTTCKACPKYSTVFCDGYLAPGFFFKKAKF